VSGDEGSPGDEGHEEDVAVGAQPEASQPARCATHPDVLAEAACAHCGTFSCSDCLHTIKSARICHTCITAGRVSAGQTPWENRAALGWLPALWQTIKQVSSAPTTFFREISPTGRIKDAIGFSLLVAIPGSITGAAMQFFIGGATALLPLLGIDSAVLTPGGEEATSKVLISTLQALFILLLGPPLAVIGSVTSACIHHLGLLIVGGGDKGLEASIKGSLYASAVRFWACIPMFKFATDIWTMVAQGVAYCQIHRNRGWQGAFAVLYASCFCLIGCCGVGSLGILIVWLTAWASS